MEIAIRSLGSTEYVRRSACDVTTLGIQSKAKDF